MADYWKSQPRKFCKFCECWFGDNKPSIDFHEQGKRHQENVKKKINEVRDKASEDAKADRGVEASLREMEKAALASLKSDVACDPTIAAQYGIENNMADKIVALTKAKEAHERVEREAREAEEEAARQLAERRKTAEWTEAKSPDGYCYYYNKANKETTWTKPDLYLSLDDQKQIEEDRKAKKAKKEEKKAQKRAAAGSDVTSKEEGIGPEMRREGLGSWEAVDEEQVVEPLDLPVGAGQYASLEEAALANWVPDDDEVEITEKTIPRPTSTDSVEPISFKKRKTGGNRNVRRRDEN